jgi:hypothetical protein
MTVIYRQSNAPVVGAPMMGGIVNKKLWSVGMVIPLAASAAVATAPAASAAAPSAAFDLALPRAIGHCSGRSDVSLTARERDRAFGRDQIVVTLRLSGRAGQVWSVSIRHNGNPIFFARKFTSRDNARFVQARGSFEVRDVVRDTRGADRFVAMAHNRRTGESCTARVTVGANRPRF